MIRIKATISGDLAGQADSAGRDMAIAITAAVAAATEGVKQDLRRQLQAGGGRFNRFRNAIRSEVYPKPPRHSLKAAGSIYAAGDSADRAFSAFAAGAVVTPQRSRALAIPLHGLRGADGRYLGPRSSYFAGRLFFVPSRDRSTAIGVLAMKAIGRPGERRKARNTKRRKGVSAAIADDLLPQFILVRAARLPKLLSPEEAVAKWAGQVPAYIEQALKIMGQ